MGIDFTRRLVAEFIGTFALIFMGAGSIIVFGGGEADIVAIALAHGLAIAILVSTLGHISGGVFNPALTVGLWATRRLDSASSIAYVGAQLLGAVAGAFALKLFPEVLGEAANWGTPLLGSETDFTQGVIIEVILTFFLMLAVFGTALDPRGPKLGGFAIGLVIAMDILAAGALTGAAMNPARTFGPALVNSIWDDHLVYWIGPIIGAVLAALVYHYVFSEREPQPAASVE
jgi:MIP family channel proteins